MIADYGLILDGLIIVLLCATVVYAATLNRRIGAVLEKKYEILEIYDREELRTARMFEDLCHFAGSPSPKRRRASSMKASAEATRFSSVP